MASPDIGSLKTDAAPASAHVVPVMTYVIVFIALLFLAGLTTAVAFVDLGPWNTPIAMAIAFVKMMLVLLIFMHLLYSPKLLRVVIVAGFFWLALLIGITLTDYHSRAWIPDPAPWSTSAPPTHP
jgi:cytochrome c oxidase subunit IV